MRWKRILEILLILSGLLSLAIGLYTISKNLNLILYVTLLGFGLFLILIAMRLRKPHRFESLKNDIVLDIQDEFGREVLYTKNSVIKVLKKNTFYYVEDMSADGHLDSFKVLPGKVVSVKNEEGKILIKTTFGHSMTKGEEFTRIFKCRFKDSFCQDVEYWVERQIYPTKEFCLTVIFPEDRPYKTSMAVKKIGAYEVKCPKPIQTMVSSRPALVLKIQNPSLKDSYKLEWMW